MTVILDMNLLTSNESYDCFDVGSECHINIYNYRTDGDLELFRSSKMD